MESVRQMSAGEEELETAGKPGRPLQYAALGYNDIAKLRG